MKGAMVPDLSSGRVSRLFLELFDQLDGIHSCIPHRHNHNFIKSRTIEVDQLEILFERTESVFPFEPHQTIL